MSLCILSVRTIASKQTNWNILGEHLWPSWYAFCRQKYTNFQQWPLEKYTKLWTSLLVLITPKWNAPLVLT